MKSRLHKSAEGPVVFRHYRWFQIFSVGMAAALVGFVILLKLADPNMGLGCFAVFLLIAVIPALALLWGGLHCRITTDAHGLTFHDFFATRFVAWKDIEEFELRPASGGAKNLSGFIKFDGKWRWLWIGYRPYDTLVGGNF